MSPASSNAPLSLAPASTCNSLISRSASAFSIAGRSTRPSALGSGSTSTASGQAGLRSPAVTIRTPPPSRMRADAGVCACRSTITRRGCRVVVTARTFIRGSSCSTVPDAREDRAGAGAPCMSVGTRLGPGDPLALPIAKRGAAIEARRKFRAHPWTAARQQRQEARVELACRVFAQSDLDGNARRAQPLRAACLARIGIAHRGDHARDAGREHGIDARRTAAMRVAGLERHVQRGATDIGAAPRRVRERVHFGMRLPRALVKAFADDRAFAHDDAADARIRRRRVQAARGELERARHVRTIGVRISAHASVRGPR